MCEAALHALADAFKIAQRWRMTNVTIRRLLAVCVAYCRNLKKSYRASPSSFIRTATPKQTGEDSSKRSISLPGPLGSGKAPHTIASVTPRSRPLSRGGFSGFDFSQGLRLTSLGHLGDFFGTGRDVRALESARRYLRYDLESECRRSCPRRGKGIQDARLATCDACTAAGRQFRMKHDFLTGARTDRLRTQQGFFNFNDRQPCAVKHYHL